MLFRLSLAVSLLLSVATADAKVIGRNENIMFIKHDLYEYHGFRYNVTYDARSRTMVGTVTDPTNESTATLMCSRPKPAVRIRDGYPTRDQYVFVCQTAILCDPEAPGCNVWGSSNGQAYYLQLFNKDFFLP